MSYSKICYTLVIVALLLFYTTIQSYAAECKLEIRLDKHSYLLREPIYLDVLLINTYQDIQFLKPLGIANHNNMFIELKDKKGISQEYTGIQYYRNADSDYVCLKSGEYDFKSYDLRELFSIENDTSFCCALGDFPAIKEGTYTVQVYIGNLFSNELSFNVVEPSGEEREVLELINFACHKWTQENPEPSAMIFEQVLEIYPNSVYAERCFYFSRLYSKEVWNGLKNGTYHLTDLKKELISKHPNSGRSENWLNAITYKMDANSKREFIEAILEKYPNTRLEKFARSKLKKMTDTKER